MSEMVNSIQNINEQTKKVAVLIENSAAATEETTAVLEEQHASIENISSSVQKLIGHVEDMKITFGKTIRGVMLSGWFLRLTGDKAFSILAPEGRY